jgi:hypothetical protein
VPLRGASKIACDALMDVEIRACTHKSTTLIDVRLSPHRRRKSGHFLTAASCHKQTLGRAPGRPLHSALS